MFSSLLRFALLSLALPYSTVASSHGAVSHRRHESIAHNVTEHIALERRGQTYNNARLTFYEAGLGACGKVNNRDDYIVALNSPMYGGGYPGPNCFRPIAITYNGKTVSATIMDECPGCPGDGGLDLTEGLFAALASLDKGVIYASWHFTDEGGNDDNNNNNDDDKKTTTKWWEPETTTHKPKTTSTTHKEEPTTTSSTKKKTTSHSSTQSSTTHSSTSSSTSTSSSSSSSSTPSSTSTSSSVAPTPTGPNILGKLNQAFVGLNELMLAGAQAA